MERLDISVTPERANIEVAIHFARYAIGKSVVKGKRVLDFACGEGYGSYLLKQAGAEHVMGVDVSSDSIARATQLFGDEGIEFKVADATNLAALFSECEFDVVISVETIEHLADPVSFLKGLKRVAKPDGVIILSCPNDYWYYPEDHQANPYHRRKYRLREFQVLCTSVLGNNVRWSVGTGLFGFGSTPLNAQGTYCMVPDSWMSYMDVGGAYLVCGEGDPGISDSQCSYFIGVWNAPHWEMGLAVFPLSMDDYATMVRAHNGELALPKTDNAVLRAEAIQMNNALDDALPQSVHANHESRRLGLKWQAAQAEVEAVREGLIAANTENARLQEKLVNLQAENETYRIGYHRYVRLSRLMPALLRSLMVKATRVIRSWKEA